jgi:hypothetical protein
MNKHTFDPISFVFGAGFLALAAVFALPAEPWNIYFDLNLGWVLPLAILAVGVALVVPVFRSPARATAGDLVDDHAEIDEAHREALAELDEEVAGPSL